MILNDGILADIKIERERQERLRDDGKFVATCATPRGLRDAECLTILVEEVGEVSHEINETIGRFLSGAEWETYRSKLRNELIQVAAVAVAWCERIDFEAKP